MAYVHIAHDDVVGSHCVIANRVSLAGEVAGGRLGASSAATWPSTSGRASAPIRWSRAARCWVKDLPPYVIVRNDTLRFAGINKVGLSRRGFTPEAHRRDPRRLPHPLPERAELPGRLRGGGAADSPERRPRRTAAIHPRVAARNHQALCGSMRKKHEFTRFFRRKCWFLRKLFLYLHCRKTNARSKGTQKSPYFVVIPHPIRAFAPKKGHRPTADEASAGTDKK